MSRRFESAEHERVVLGSMMTSPAVVEEIVDRRVTAEMFYRPPHRTLFEAILAAYEAGEPVEPVALTQRLANSGELTKVGGAPYLHTLVQSVPTAANAGHYVRELAEMTDWRRLDVTKARIGQLVEQPGERSPADVVDFARQMLDDLTVRADASDPVVWADLIDSGLAQIEAAGSAEATVKRLPTGFVDLDRLLGGGLGDGHLVIVAGRTSMGKSVLARNILAQTAFGGKAPAVLFTMEMTRQEVFECLLSAGARVPLHLIQAGQLSDQDWTRCARWVGETTDAPLFVDDSSEITLAEIRSRCRRLKQRQGDLRLVVVDYLQLMQTTGRSDNRQQAIGDLSRGLKMLAGELGCPVIAVSQLNRGPEQRADKTPQISDLRESGSIENDANTVILLFRPEYYDKSSPRAGEADFIVAKNRGGPQDTVTVAAQLHLSRFVDMAIV